ncbi:uncharacterized protein IL334_002381 [Kwoniella shivajii]|uniref:CUE domain-containing protein n=1 Tax=Kwoniella shivajii TaxID=564305 RepID=A0ABZ1CUK5_9TREE|nr:hypothetical protein IL334_002381 [Kwoniella shivajii]
MEDIIPTLIIIGAIYLLVRWFTGSKTNDSGGGIRGVTRPMVDTVHGAFPHIPIPNIIYSLSRTRSAQATSEEILERGTLPAPPPNFSIPASLLPEIAITTPTAGNTPQTANTNSKSSFKNTSLIDRYNLSSRIPSHKGKEREIEPDSPTPTASGTSTPSSDVGSKSEEDKMRWEDTKEKRELTLKERKEKMILEARRRLLEKQAQSTA